MRFILLGAVLLALAAPAAAVAQELQAGTDRSDTGSYPLSWDAGGHEVVLQESTRPDFSDAREIYRGRDERTVVSGRLDGDYFYRLRRADGEWQVPVRVTVAHHGLAKALAFLVVGAVVFLSTAALIIVGHLRQRDEVPDDRGEAA